MKYLPLRSFESVSAGLNFRTPDCEVLGGCDLYTTKAAGADKKLYKHIETSLESQHNSILRLSASLSPPQAESMAEAMNLSRSSPFGPLSQISSRRTYAYLIATLNASHPDYDFSQTLRPTDFVRKRSYKDAVQVINSTMENLRPGFASATYTMSSAESHALTGPRLWSVIDKEMDLKQCHTYCYSPDEDPFEDEDGSLWSLNYFFFNKQRRRVCYFYLRGLSLAGAPMSDFPTPMPTPKRKHSARQSLDLSANKRARYWFGDRVDSDDVSSFGGYDEDLYEDRPAAEDDGEVEVVDETGKPDEEDRYVIEKGLGSPTTTMTTENTSDDEMNSRERAKSAPRAVSEGVVEGMDV